MSSFLFRLAAVLALSGLACPAIAAEPPIAPKVFVVTMFNREANPWLESGGLQRKVTIPGLFRDFPDIACSDEGLCLITTGMGYANAASSIAALVFSGRFDLRKSYFVIAGIAGMDPAAGALGSAHWARFVVDGGLQNEIDARQIPADWTTGYLPLGAPAPGTKAKFNFGSEVYRLDENLVQAAFRITKNVALETTDAAKSYEAKYFGAETKRAPQVTICDTISSDTWWAGTRLATAMAAYAKFVTDGEANPCTTQQEDNAILTALGRGAEAGLLDFNRIAVLRAAADFDREAPGQSAVDVLRVPSGGYALAAANAHRVAEHLAQTILADWATWNIGPPR